MKHEARCYQKRGLDQIRTKFKSGIKRVLLYLSTGGGKTFMFSEVMRGTAERGNHCVMLVRGRKLVEQAHERLVREGVHHGVMMANHWNFRPTEKIQICSIDTLRSRGIIPNCKLLVLDEADTLCGKGDSDFIKKFGDVHILAVTATPYVARSMRHIAQTIVHPATFQDLVDLGYLVRPRYYSLSIPDLTGIKIVKGDYQNEALEAVMSKKAIMGDIVSHWKRLGQNRPTICFAVSIAHSHSIVDSFNAAGIKAIHVDADSTDAQRNEVIKALENGTVQVVSNVGIFCRGVDIPAASCLIFARPTASRNLFVQQAGRGTRPTVTGDTQDERIAKIKDSVKPDFLILDHAGNVTRHGLISEEPEINLDGTNSERSKSPKTCSNCFAVFYGLHCPECDTLNEVESRRRIIEQVAGELSELNIDSPVFYLNYLKRERKKNGYHWGWIFHRFREKYGDELAGQYDVRESAY